MTDLPPAAAPRAAREELHLDVTAITGLLVVGVIGALSVLHGGEAGSTVAAAAVGGIAGYLTRGAPRVTTRSAGDPPTTTTTETQP